MKYTILQQQVQKFCAVEVVYYKSIYVCTPKLRAGHHLLAFKLKRLKSLFLINNETRCETPADNIQDSQHRDRQLNAPV
jgi:hypothetical protein